MSEAVNTASSSVEATSIETHESAGQQAVPSYAGTKHKLKVNQQEIELPYEELISRAQRSEAADARFKEAAAIRKESLAAKQEADAFLNDPWGYLKGKNKDPYELAESLLMEKIRYENLSDEQREALAAKMEAADLRKWKEEREGKDKEAQSKELTAKAVEAIDLDIADALKSLGRKPTPRLVARIAETMLAHLSKSEDGQISAKNVLGKVTQEYQADITEYLSQMSPDQLRQVLPRELLDGLRKSDVEKAMSQAPAGARRRIVSTDGDVKSAPKKRMSSDEYFAQLDKKFSRR